MKEDFILFNKDIILENERAKLTPLTLEDFHQLESVAYEPQLWKLGMSNIETPEELKAYINKAMQEKAQNISYPFMVYDKKMNVVAGSTRYGNISLSDKRLEIGWTWIHPRHQGTGLNKACKFLLLQYAFEELQMNRVELKTDVLNLQSRSAIKKIGATEEGVFRKHGITYSGRVRDSIFFSILHDEWPGIKEKIFHEFIK